MNWEQIETPANRRTAALPYAEQRRKTRDQADGCVKWLKAQGFSVQRIEPGPVCPRIVIHASPLCGQLEGAIGGFERGPHGECRYSFVFRFGCEVRWYEGGAV